MIRTRIVASVLGSFLVIGGAALAQRPARNVSGDIRILPPRQKVVAAQQANEWDLGGHAQKAKRLLDQVNNELKLAAETANRRR